MSRDDVVFVVALPTLSSPPSQRMTRRYVTFLPLMRYKGPKVRGDVENHRVLWRYIVHIFILKSSPSALATYEYDTRRDRSLTGRRTGGEVRAVTALIQVRRSRSLAMVLLAAA